MLWTFSHAHLKEYSTEEADYLKAAKVGFDFISQNYLDPQYGGYYWATDMQGNPTDKSKSLLDQLYVITAFLQYHKASNDSQALQKSVELFRLINQKLKDDQGGQLFDMFQQDWTMVGKPLGGGPRGTIGLTSNTCVVYYIVALTHLFSATKDPEVKSSLENALDKNFEEFFPEDPSGTVQHRLPDSRIYGRKPAGTYGNDLQAITAKIQAEEALGRTLDWEFFDRYIRNVMTLGTNKDGAILHRFSEILWWPQAEFLTAISLSGKHRGDRLYRDELLKTLRFLECSLVDSETGLWMRSPFSKGNPQMLMNDWKTGSHTVGAIVGFVEVFGNAAGSMAGGKESTPDSNGRVNSGYQIRRPVDIRGLHFEKPPTGGRSVKEANYPLSMRHFVRADGPNLYLGKSKYFVTGFTTYQLVARSAWFHGRSQVLQSFWDMQDMGVNTVRVYAYSDGLHWNAIQPMAGYLDGMMLDEGLDYVMGLAREHDMRIIFTLTGLISGFGGMEQYAQWMNRTSVTDFYTDETIKGMFKDYICAIVTRKNSKTGVRYFDDPTILAWDLATRPRDPGHPDSESLQAWIVEMAAYVKSLDPNHLVMVGLEGFFGESTPKYHHANPYTNSRGVLGTRHNETGPQYYGYDAVCEGTNFVKNHEAKNVDLASAGLFPSLWTSCNETCTLDFVRTWVRSHLEASQVLGKPFLLSEMAVAKPIRTRNRIYKAVFDELHAAAQEGHYVAGSLVWTVAAGTFPDFDGYSVYRNNRTAVYLPKPPVKVQTYIKDAGNLTMLNSGELLACIDSRLAERDKEESASILPELFTDHAKELGTLEGY
ncbi:hypothetical protein BSKO_00622 [Bryopsis sp. KO-2023]|nr:hypothetical protein BSKO_00622 [Bryopsis sp. KO-2023]